MKDNLPSDYLSTAQVAAALSVSVSTVKRWVEDGILPAHKTAGGHRKLLYADVLEIARQNELPLQNPGLASNGTTRKRVKLSTEPLAQQLYGDLISGDSDAVRRVVRGAYSRGMPIETLADAVIAPAMHRIGHDWERGRIDVMHEHRASRLCEATLYELKAVLEATARRSRPKAVGGALEDDLSEIPTLLAQMVLLNVGWNAINLGANTPIASLSVAIEELKPRLLWISISHVSADRSLLATYEQLYQQAERANVALILGGRGITDNLRKTLPHTVYGDGFAQLAAFARTLHPIARRPRRGRPKE